eukprot:c6279_g1_i1.p1 GENE.c6279_g1_i1~~c6279_g1_i1.p1  ORF type:complete len:813 (+),score=220.50 c6279_g1_i1:39-2477(+)
MVGGKRAGVLVLVAVLFCFKAASATPTWMFPGFPTHPRQQLPESTTAAPPLSCLQALAASQQAMPMQSFFSTYKPQCNDDGTYAPIQCWFEMRMCWCATADGKEVRNSRVPLPYGASLRCPQAARPKQQNESVPKTKEDGEFDPLISPVAANELALLAQQVADFDSPTSPAFTWNDNIVLFLGKNQLEGSGSRKQLFAVTVRGGTEEGKSDPVQLTEETENVVGFVPRPEHPTEVVLILDHKGTEHPQFVLLDIETKARQVITDDPKSSHFFGSFSPCGTMFTYTLIVDTTTSSSTSSTIVKTYNMETTEHTTVREYVDPVGVSVGAISHDLRFVVVEVENEISQDSDLEMIDLTTAANGQTPRVITPHSDNVATWFGTRFHPEQPLLYVVSNEGQEYFVLQAIDLVTHTRHVLLPSHPTADVQHVSFSAKADFVAVVINQNGYGEFHLYSVSEDGLRFTEIATKLNHRGLLTTPLRLAHDATRMIFVNHLLIQPGPVVMVEIENGRAIHEMTITPPVKAIDLIGPEAMGETEPVTYTSSLDHVTIPAYHVMPPDQVGESQKAPYVVLVHGGPKSSSGPALTTSMGNALAYLNTKGLGVLSLNIRGSVGFGKQYSLLDIGNKRQNAVQDVMDAVAYLKTLPSVDPSRIAIVGGSYGGWMVLQALTTQHHSEFTAGIDVFGMSNMETFMKSTAPRRRKNRMLEYGSEASLLRELSPVNHACALTAHLLIIQGENDIRVPVSQSTQMVAAVNKCRDDNNIFNNKGSTTMKKNIPPSVELVVLKGEGHGFVETNSKLHVLKKVVGFLAKQLKMSL